MMAALKMADNNKGYFMTDSSTWVVGRKEMSNLTILFKGAPFLINTYYALCQPEGVTEGQPHASRFIKSFVGMTKKSNFPTFCDFIKVDVEGATSPAERWHWPR